MDEATEVNYEVSHQIDQIVVDPDPKNNTWEILLGTALPLNYQPEEKKKRGRPRKLRPGATGKTVHKIETLPAPTAQLPQGVIDQIHEDFKKFNKLHKLPIKVALEEICKKFNISYPQAYTLLESDI